MSLLSTQGMVTGEGIKDFIIKNNLLTTMASVTVGLVSSDFIKSLVSDIIFPLLVLLMRMTHIKFLQVPISNNTNFHFRNFFQSTVSLVISILVTYFFITYVSSFVNNIKEDGKKKNA